MKCTLNGYKRRFRRWLSEWLMIMYIISITTINDAVCDILTMMLTELKDINKGNLKMQNEKPLCICELPKNKYFMEFESRYLTWYEKDNNGDKYMNCQRCGKHYKVSLCKEKSNGNNKN
jgi:hypothetical protein